MPWQQSKTDTVTDISAITRHWGHQIIKSKGNHKAGEVYLEISYKRVTI